MHKDASCGELASARPAWLTPCCGELSSQVYEWVADSDWAGEMLASSYGAEATRPFHVHPSAFPGTGLDWSMLATKQAF